MSRHRRRLSRRQRGILKMKRKLALLFVVIVLLLMGIIVRLVYINRVSGEQYKKRVLAQQDTKSQTLPYKRGDIYDRNGTVLATSEKVYNLILDPGVLWKNYDEDAKKDCVEPTLSALVEYFDLDRSELNTIMQEKKDSHYVMLKKQLTKSEVQDFEEAMDDKDSRIEGVWLEDTYIRRYPYDSLACNVIGYTVSGNVGQYGIEQQYSDTLNGEDGRTYNYLNEDLEQEKNVRAAVDGDSVMSTIDVTLQEIVEKAIDDFQEKYTNNFREGEAGSKTAAAIMMDPNTGEILAMASNRKYDLNQPYDLVANGIATQEESDAMTEEERLDKLNELWRNFCVSDTYEPGSTAKPITVAAALESGVVHDGDTFLCDGRQNVGGHEIWCAKKIGHGVIDLEGSLKFSCNDALMQIAAKLGEEEYSKYQNLFNPIVILHVWAPDLLDNEIIGQYLACVFSKKAHDLVLILSQIHIPVSHIDPVLVIIDEQVSCPELPGLHAFRRQDSGSRMADGCPHPRQQLGSAKGLCNIIICTCIQCCHLILLVSSGRDHQNRHG